MADIEIRGLNEVIVDLREFPKKFETKVLNQLSQVAYDSAQKGAGRHIVTGALFQSLFNRKEQNARRVGHDKNRAPHASLVIQGTIPHFIPPKNKKALRWPVAGGAGGFAFSKGHDHPGYKGDPYMDKAAADAFAKFNTILDAALRESI